jgi:hypothetical protein
MSRKYSFDHTEDGLRKTLKEYQEIALRHVWESEEGLPTAPVWRHVNEVLSEKGDSRSRASIIFFLDDMVEEGVLDDEVTTGKGGRFRIYKTKMDEREYRKHMLRKVIESMIRDSPEEAREVIQEYE